MDMSSSSMNMGSSSMSMSMPSPTSMNMGSSSTISSAAAASSAAGGMGGMSMGGMGGGHACKISMLWNWYTIDACFLSSQWHITSKGMFAGSCIGVVLLVIVLEALRRASREYDHYLLRQGIKRHTTTTTISLATESSDDGKDTIAIATNGSSTRSNAITTGSRPIKPNVFEQAIRALLHMLQFAVAYFIMLLAMYFNGYIIICIFIGAFIGAFVFSWQAIGSTGGGEQGEEQREVTYCCG